MKCYICGKEMEKITGFCDLPADKYQGLVSNTSIRSWYSCSDCNFHSQDIALNDNEISDIYSQYRSLKIRDKTIPNTFAEIISLPYDKSENIRRCDIFSAILKKNYNLDILDIGSGLGVFPYRLKELGFENISCVETTPDSLDFIENELGFKCYPDISSIPSERKFDVITLVHVLEHFRDPVAFLDQVRFYLKYDGILFIEVPYDDEFNTLDSLHDEFNSLHMHFYNTISLYKVLDMANVSGVKTFQIVEYPERRLSRLIVTTERG